MTPDLSDNTAALCALLSLSAVTVDDGKCAAGHIALLRRVPSGISQHGGPAGGVTIVPLSTLRPLRFCHYCAHRVTIQPSSRLARIRTGEQCSPYRPVASTVRRYGGSRARVNGHLVASIITCLQLFGQVFMRVWGPLKTQIHDAGSLLP